MSFYDVNNPQVADDIPIRSALIPVGDLSIDERRAMRRNTDAILAITGVDKDRIKDSPNDLVIRDIWPNTDLGLGIGVAAAGGAPAGAGAGQDWLIQGAGVVGTELAMVNFQLAQGKHMAFYGVSVELPTHSLSTIRLRLGAAGSSRMVGQLEKLYSRLETMGYFTNVVVFTQGETVGAFVMPRLAFAVNTERLALEGRVIEAVDIVVGRPAL